MTQQAGSTLVQVMACCLMAPSHYRNQGWLIDCGVLRHSPEGNFMGNAEDTCPPYDFENNWFEITATFPREQLIYSLWPIDAICRHRSGATLAHIMASCLTAPSHYLNQCWLNIGEVLWHSPEGNFTGNAQYFFLWYEFEKNWFKITATSLRDHLVNHVCYLPCVKA